MLEYCTAQLITRDPAEARQLYRIAQLAGFSRIEEVSSRRAFDAADKPNRINFFLAHEGVGAGPLGAILRAVRTREEIDVRFAPVILFANDMEFESYLGFIRMGFDDVVTLPDKLTMIKSRLCNQLSWQQVYYETKDYFGPDRRRMELGPPLGVERSAVPHSHVRHEFIRNPKTGVRIERSIIKLPVDREKSSRDRRHGEHGHWERKAVS
ncbi:hypothetical protein GGR20_001805 [Devosia subaequoris]|uniref:Response regulator n=1 Tax=Devosia subaequoris TaxID=395930 RepID=A0A7W6IN07_9HYPH|nr:hypothetical protein [Devosia subaequoris]MBB4052162.1 hypothetical protein [Devosia subaequoris]MCP1209326.1 hypothetical protein [Devosia subaequoris]